jgi:PAS domain S-box-containing protein
MYIKTLKYTLVLFVVLATLSGGSALAQPAPTSPTPVVQSGQSSPVDSKARKLDITLFGRNVNLTLDVSTLNVIVILALSALSLTAIFLAILARRRTRQTQAANRTLQVEVTQRKRAEEEARQLNDTLEHRVAERTAELESANTELGREVAERIGAEKALSAALEKERLLSNNAIDVICTIDSNGRFVTINPACERLWGYTQEELIGHRFIELVVPEDVTKTNEAATKIMNGEQATDFENRYLHKNGSQVHVMWSAYWSESQRLIFSVARDMTQRHLVEEKLKKSAAELQRSNSELQDFASVASHDLQEPLRKIQSFADELQLSMGDKIDADDKDTLHRIIAAGDRMRTLINDLLSFARVTSMAKPFAAVDLNVIVKDVLSTLAARLDQTEGLVEVDDLPTIDGDPMQLYQLLQNLIGNGLKFHAPGVPPILKISGENGGPNYRLSVTDNGIGFDEKYLDRIFTVFQRLHGRKEYEGTGIGLAICRKIAERHGGQITATSAPGAGSTFTVTLPVHQSNEEKS